MAAYRPRRAMRARQDHHASAFAGARAPPARETAQRRPLLRSCGFSSSAAAPPGLIVPRKKGHLEQLPRRCARRGRCGPARKGGGVGATLADASMRPGSAARRRLPGCGSAGGVHAGRWHCSPKSARVRARTSATAGAPRPPSLPAQRACRTASSPALPILRVLDEALVEPKPARLALVVPLKRVVAAVEQLPRQARVDSGHSASPRVDRSGLPPCATCRRVSVDIVQPTRAAFIHRTRRPSAIVPRAQG